VPKTQKAENVPSNRSSPQRKTFKMEDDEEVSEEEDYSEDEDVYSQQSDSPPTSKDQKILKDLESP